MSSGDPAKSQTLAKAAQNLRRHKPPPLLVRTKDSASELDSRRSNRAAVLICLFAGDNGEIRVLLTRRSSSLSSYSGEVALPGGKWEDGDTDDADTALREAQEEIGLNPSSVEVVTVLEPFYTKRNIIVYPVVGILWDKTGFNPVPNATEVESLFDAPLEMFLKDENRREGKGELMGVKFTVHFFDYKAENNKAYVIWALTAAIFIRVASVVFQRPPDFEERLPEFWSRTRL